MSSSLKRKIVGIIFIFFELQSELLVEAATPNMSEFFTHQESSYRSFYKSYTCYEEEKKACEQLIIRDFERIIDRKRKELKNLITYCLNLDSSIKQKFDVFFKVNEGCFEKCLVETIYIDDFIIKRAFLLCVIKELTYLIVLLESELQKILCFSRNDLLQELMHLKRDDEVSPYLVLPKDGGLLVSPLQGFVFACALPQEEIKREIDEDEDFLEQSILVLK